MGTVSAAFFSWVQGARFYIDVHAEAVHLLSRGENKTWLDIGCGPGLVARLAARRGYAAVGIDSDPKMIQRAKHLAGRGAYCRFEVGDLKNVGGHYSADVVSAASLLFVVPDPAAALQQLWNCVRPGGTLLVIETTEAMTPRGALKAMNRISPGRRIALTLWAQARNGRAVDSRFVEALPATSGLRTPLLHGMVAAWTLTKETA